MKKLPGFSLLLMIVVTGHATADADGPDCFQVRGVATEDVLNIRSEADTGARKIGEISPGADGVKNLGCKGGLTFEEFSTHSNKEQAAINIRRPRWCRIDYLGTRGWVAGRFLTEGGCGR